MTDNRQNTERLPNAATLASLPNNAGAGRAERTAWGGSRNRRDRETRFLSKVQAENIAAAAGHALRLGFPLNRHVTWHLEKSGVAPDDGAKAIGRFLKLHRQFLASRGQPFACLWVREDDDGDRSKGAHVHILMHVPSAAAPFVTRRQRRWVRKATGKPYRVGSLHTSRIGGKVRTAETLPGLYRHNLAAVLAYVLKGAEPGANDTLRECENPLVASLALSRHSEGGRVIGKRCGWTENIGAAVRKTPVLQH